MKFPLAYDINAQDLQQKNEFKFVNFDSNGILNFYFKQYNIMWFIKKNTINEKYKIYKW